MTSNGDCMVWRTEEGRESPGRQPSRRRFTMIKTHRPLLPLCLLLILSLLLPLSLLRPSVLLLLTVIPTSTFRLRYAIPRFLSLKLSFFCILIVFLLLGFFIMFNFLVEHLCGKIYVCVCMYVCVDI